MRSQFHDLVITIMMVLVSLSVSACAKVATSGAQSSDDASTSANGTWTAGCTSQGGIAGIAPPSSLSYTSSISINDTNLTYFVQGYTDAGCTTPQNSLTYDFSISPTGPDTAVAPAADITMTVSSTSSCTSGSCVSDGNVGAVYLGLFQVVGNFLSIDWAAGMRPSSPAFTFSN